VRVRVRPDSNVWRWGNRPGCSNEALSADNARLQQELERSKASNEALSADNARLNRELNELLRSTSWRITKPLRALRFIDRDEPRYAPPNLAFKTWNNCPPNYTVQDGLCKPYRGR
jgi:hypothetical protein